MAVIDLHGIDVDVVEVPREELLRLLDERCRDLLGMTGEEFLEAVSAGREIDHPAADRLEILAEALIEPERRSR
jgi:hypothetical protein